MKFLVCLCLLICLNSCARSRQPLPDYTWVQSIHFTHETIEWFKAQGELPEYVKQDLLKIHKHNLKVKAILGR